MGCMAVLMTASCNKADDNTEEQQKKWNEWIAELQKEIRAMPGDYQGQIFFLKSAAPQETDSVAAQWSVANDSTIILTGLPTDLIARNISDSHPALKQALTDAHTMDVTVKIGYNLYQRTPIAFYLYPQPVSMTLDINGTPNKVTVEFKDYNTDSRAYGQFLAPTGEILMNYYPKSIAVEGQVQEIFSQDAILKYYGKKK